MLIIISEVLLSVFNKFGHVSVAHLEKVVTCIQSAAFVRLDVFCVMR